MRVSNMQPSMVHLSTALLSSCLLQVLAQNYCPPLGPTLPAPRKPASNDVVNQTMQGLLEELLTQTQELNASALSVNIQSIHGQTPMLDFHHTPPVLSPEGTQKVDADTVYRIASVSKVYTVLAILQLSDRISLADPITRYVPELAELAKEESVNNAITTIDWNSVTVGALCSQLGGIGQVFGNDLANTDGPFEEYGLPPLASTDVTDCGGEPDQRGCTRADFFAKFGLRHPVYAPFTTPVYSDNAYSILGFALEAATNQSYSEYMQQHVFGPLNATRTSVGKPADDSIGFISNETNYWNTSLGFEDPSGGIYSTPHDLLTFALSILNHTLLPPLLTRTWLKPSTHTSSLGLSVGAPWEITRSNNLTTDRRVLDIYTKTGGQGDYNTMLLLIQDYDVAMTVMFAGKEASADVTYVLVSKIVRALVPALEAAGKAEANATFGGTYVADGKGDTAGSNITLTIDSGPGLKVSSFHVRGKDIISAYPTIINGGEPTDGPTPDIRLYPTKLNAGNQSAWRVVFNTGEATAAESDEMLFWVQGSCESWSELDLTTYGLSALDDFVIGVGEGGVAGSVVARGWRVEMGRVGS